MKQVVKEIVTVLLLILLFFAIFLAIESEASCRTHKCWNRVHVNRLEKMVQKKIDRITPYSCRTVTGRFRSAKPCWVIGQESGMMHMNIWTVLNTWVSGRPCGKRACGPYQFVDKPVPWPVIAKSKYETLKRKLAHHRQAARLALSHW